MPHPRSLIATLAFSLVLLCFSSAFAQTPDRAQIEKGAQSLHDREKQKLLLAPSKEDQENDEELFEQPVTGLIRLLPRDRYKGKPAIKGGGAYYSFTRLAHEYGNGSDIELDQGRFSVGFVEYDFGFLVDLGETPLEEITL